MKDNILRHVGRCPLCGRFMKRGFCNWIEHTCDECTSPKAEHIRSEYKAFIYLADIYTQAKASQTN